MMESPSPQPETGEAETPTQKQARLRRERREAKIKAGGSARLEKITNLSGRQNLPDQTPTSPPNHEADPEEVDLTTHPSASASRTPNNGAPPSEADIRALLRSGAPQPGVDIQSPDPGAEDPMMKMLSQLMGGGMPSGENDAGAGEGGGLPPGLAAMLGAGGVPGGAAAPQDDTSAYLWKIVHAVFALLLGVYVTATSTAFFRGRITRGAEVVGGGGERAGMEDGVNLFWVFATAELVLQSSRFFLERGKGGGQLGGWLGLVGGFLPQPWKGYVLLAARYARIWSTVVEDAMVVVFVVGCVSWWKGAAG